MSDVRSNNWVIVLTVLVTLGLSILGPMSLLNEVLDSSNGLKHFVAENPVWFAGLFVSGFLLFSIIVWAASLKTFGHSLGEVKLIAGIGVCWGGVGLVWAFHE